MMNCTKLAVTALALAAMGHVVSAQMASDKMSKPAAAEKSFTGCVEAGTTAGTYTLTHVTADMGMAKDTMTHDTMKKNTMAKDAMAMAPKMLSLSSSTIDLAKHVGHKVTVTGTMGAMASSMAKMDKMAKPDQMGKTAKDSLTVTSLKMVSASCGM
jgi:hypothetical protein